MAEKAVATTVYWTWYQALWRQEQATLIENEVKILRCDRFKSMAKTRLIWAALWMIHRLAWFKTNLFLVKGLSLVLLLLLCKLHLRGIVPMSLERLSRRPSTLLIRLEGLLDQWQTINRQHHRASSREIRTRWIPSFHKKSRQRQTLEHWINHHLKRLEQLIILLGLKVKVKEHLSTKDL